MKYQILDDTQKVEERAALLHALSREDERASLETTITLLQKKVILKDSVDPLLPELVLEYEATSAEEALFKAKFELVKLKLKEKPTSAK